MKKNNSASDKRALLIGAILTKDNERLQALSGSNAKRVVVRNTFLDDLMYSSNDAFKDKSIVFIETEQHKQMWEEIESNTI